MRQVIFSRMRPAGDRWSVSGRACAFRSVIGASSRCPEQRGAARNPSRQPGLRAELSPVRHHSRPGLSRLADSPACDAIPQFDAHCLNCGRTVLLHFPTPPGHAVTMALHARNAKKIYSRKRPLKSSIVRNSACNDCQSASIFSENASVSYAVDSSIDHMMLSRNRTTDFPYWSTLVGALARVMAHRQAALLPCTADRGTL